VYNINRGFLGSGYSMMQDKFYHDRHPLPWQRNLGQHRLKLGLYSVYELSRRSLCITGGFEGQAIE